MKNTVKTVLEVLMYAAMFAAVMFVGCKQMSAADATHFEGAAILATNGQTLIGSFEYSEITTQIVEPSVSMWKVTFHLMPGQKLSVTTATCFDQATTITTKNGTKTILMGAPVPASFSLLVSPTEIILLPSDAATLAAFAEHTSNEMTENIAITMTATTVTLIGKQ